MIKNEKSGLVYFIGSQKHKVVKIGVTQNDSPTNRMATLQTGCPFELELFGVIKCTSADCFIVEKEMHNIFSLYKTHGEWFSLEGFLELFLIDAFGDQKEQIASKYKRDSDSSWYFPYSKIDYIKKCAVSHRKNDITKSVLLGMEYMIKDVMSRNAELESAMDAISAFLSQIKSVIDNSEPTKLRNKSMNIEYELISQNYGMQAKLDAAKYLCHKSNFIFDNFWGNGFMPIDNPEKDILEQQLL